MPKILLLIILIFPFLNKYSYVITNQYSQIPIILRFLDNNYLKNDWYVNTSSQLGVRTIFAYYMAQTAKIFPLSLSFFIHYIFYIFFIGYSTYKLSLIIFQNRLIATITSICVLFGSTISLGGNILVTEDFSAPQLPLAITLLGITFILEEKYILSSIVFSLASYLHPLIGFESSAVFIISRIISKLLLKKNTWIIIKKCLIPYILFTLPAIFFYFKISLEEQAKNTLSSLEKIYILAYMRNPHHYVPSAFPRNHYWLFFLLLILISYSLFFSRKKLSKSVSIFIGVATEIILFFCLLGFLGTEIFPYYPLVVLQPFRMTQYIYWFGKILTIGYFMKQGLTQKKYYSFIFFLPIVLSDIRITEFKGKINILALIVGIIFMICFKKMPKKISIIVLITIFSLLRIHNKFNFSNYYRYPIDETKLALWAKNNTSTNSIFLVPPEFESFRLVASRSIVADWKSFPFQESAIKEWAERMCDIGNIQKCDYKRISKNDIINGYRLLREKHILNLSKKYNFQYFISDIPYPFEKFKINNFYIYNLESFNKKSEK